MQEMFEQLPRLPDDPILGLMAAYRADPEACKVDLGVGVYRDENGHTPVLESVRRAERAVLERQTTKAYVAPAGNAQFNESMERLVFGADHAVLRDGRVCTVQTPGGSGALRVAAELIRAASPGAEIQVSAPTWANHVPLLSGAGLRLGSYSYFDARTGALAFDDMLASLNRLPERTIVLLQAACHNPTGVDLNEAQWRQVLGVVKQRELTALIDMAYQGLGSGVAEDAFAVRLFAAELPELIVAVSCSKNFGLYRERAGAIHIVNETRAAARAVLSQLTRIVRTLYSMPPDHGAAIVQEILGDVTLREVWLQEVCAMRLRMAGLREEAARQLAAACPIRDFGFITRQRGMFSYLGVTAEQARELRTKHHIYMMEDGRINIAGLRQENLAYFAQAVSQVLRS